MTRFGMDYEMDAIFHHLAEEQGEWGVTVDWYRWDETSPVDDLYDVGAPRQWKGPIFLPVQFALVIEGQRTRVEWGKKVLDSLTLAVSKDVFRHRIGWDPGTEIGDHKQFLRDRVVYNGATFTVEVVEPMGDLAGTDAMVSVRGFEVHEDVLALDEPSD